jgi:hypothetical protein
MMGAYSKNEAKNLPDALNLIKEKLPGKNFNGWLNFIFNCSQNFQW